MKLAEVIKAVGADADGIFCAAKESEPIGYSIDSRAIRAGELFFAIRGVNRDGHSFVAEALNKGAIAAVVSRDFAASQTGLQDRLIPVQDALQALQLLASKVLASWRGCVVAITGSAGKTTTKELTAALLARIGRVIKTTGNMNNAYGLPLSILKMESDGAHASDFDFAVLEMGMSHSGEIERLTQIAPPDVGLVTIVAPVHLEFFDSIEAIADAKSEMIRGVKPGGVGVLNADDERVARMRRLRADIEFRTFAINHQADIMARQIEPDDLFGSRFVLVTPRGQIQAKLPLIGLHNLYNALAAAAVADQCRVPIEEIAAVLATCSSPQMRGQVIRLGEVTVVDDSYNSNPRALAEIVAALSQAKARCHSKRLVVVAGEMLELGETAPALHMEAGRRLVEYGVDLLIGVRGLAREIVRGASEAGMSAERTFFCEDSAAAAELLLEKAQPGDLILVKGSRGVKMELIIASMNEKWGEKKQRE
jgi:UDP-N-acetylmuramoyl-tripeptide--D-alanyl-D-alanine ligase